MFASFLTTMDIDLVLGFPSSTPPSYTIPKKEISSFAYKD